LVIRKLDGADDRKIFLEECGYDLFGDASLCAALDRDIISLLYYPALHLALMDMGIASYSITPQHIPDTFISQALLLKNGNNA
jgi:hypothetical protein